MTGWSPENSGWAGRGRAWSVDGEDELAPDVPGVADLLGRCGLVERVGGDGGDELAGRGVLGHVGQAVDPGLRASAGEGDAALLRTKVGNGDDALSDASEGDGVLQRALPGQVEHSA